MDLSASSSSPTSALHSSSEKRAFAWTPEEDAWLIELGASPDSVHPAHLTAMFPGKTSVVISG
jgi:hypothetical protein